MRLLISDLFREFRNHGRQPADIEDAVVWDWTDQVPPRHAVVDADLSVVFGPLRAGDRALELAGALNAALQLGRTVVYAYRGGLGETDSRALDRMIGFGSTSVGNISPVTSLAPVFDEYFTSFGMANATFSMVPEGSERLGRIDSESGLCAFVAPAGRGSVYVVPWHAAEFMHSYAELVTLLLRAVAQHREGASLVLPPYLADLRLAGEQSLLDEIEALESSLEQRRSSAKELERFRHLLGRLQGDPLELLVIDALNIVLGPTSYEAEDREDVGGEDFWITGPTGDVALAEVKGVGTGVRRQHVNQVDDHRAALELDTEEVPGVLIVNPFRGADSLEPKREPIHPDVIRHLRRQNVLLLRGTDLYELVSLVRAGEPAAEPLLSALHAGGGWLQVSATGVTLHPDG